LSKITALFEINVSFFLSLEKYTSSLKFLIPFAERNRVRDRNIIVYMNTL
jgi:hypothetical protein